MNFRTDLAIENYEFTEKKQLRGVKVEESNSGGCFVSRIEVLDEYGVEAVGKPKGIYVTVEVEPFAKQPHFIAGSLQVLIDEMKNLLPEKGSVLVAGLGNTGITPDALGPKCASMIFATRHIKGELLKSTGFESLRSVSAFSTGVLGNTGAEAGELIKGAVDVLKPDFVITVDALAARSVNRLGNTVQMCNSGIVPGAGVGNARQEISEKTLGIPVYAIGVPTVVDAATLIYDYSGGAASDAATQMMVTPREIDLMIERAAKTVSLAINCALQPDISAEDMLILTA